MEKTESTKGKSRNIETERPRTTRSRRGTTFRSTTNTLDYASSYEKENYKTPENPLYSVIDAKLWNDSLQGAEDEIHPNTNLARKNSRVKQYSKSQYGATSEYIMTQKITIIEITQAIKSLYNRKSVGKDGITADVMKQNQQWMIPNIQIILHSCQQSYQMPKRRLKGVMTFTPKQ